LKTFDQPERLFGQTAPALVHFSHVARDENPRGTLLPTADLFTRNPLYIICNLLKNKPKKPEER
jgi:hypothetical protein